jgi:diketogulonate reductase-like aldo/keto reductase
MNTGLTTDSGIHLPPIIYGTAWKKERTAALVEQALTLGFRGIDTAGQPKHYDEAGVGLGLAQAIKAGVNRKDIYLQTKFTPVDGQDPQRIPYDPKASLSRQVEQSFAQSLQNLRTDYLDGLILHSPLPKREDLLEVWTAMECIVDAGDARLLGISNCYELERLEDFHASARIKPAVLQNRFYAQTGYDREIRHFCQRRGIIYQSFWTLSANPNILAHASVQDLAEKYQRTTPQIFYRYLTQAGILPLIGTTSSIHMREDLDIFSFELLEQECKGVGQLLGG